MMDFQDSTPKKSFWTKSLEKQIYFAIQKYVFLTKEVSTVSKSLFISFFLI